MELRKALLQLEMRSNDQIEVRQAKPNTLDQAIAIVDKEVNLNVNLGPKTLMGCKLPNPSQKTTSKNLVHLLNRYVGYS